MYYNLCMSVNQIARCNRSLPSEHQLNTTRIVRTRNGRTSEEVWITFTATVTDPGYAGEDVVVLTAEGIRNVIAALRARPESTDRYRDEDFDYMDIDAVNLADIDIVLESVLEESTGPNMLHGVCI